MNRFNSDLHEAELREFLVEINSSYADEYFIHADRLAQDYDTKPRWMRKKRGKRFDGVIKGRINTYFEFKTSKFIFPNESRRPCVKIFYDDYWKLLQTIRYTENHSKHIYVMKNNWFEDYSEYITLEIGLDTFSNASEIEPDRLIFYLDNSYVKPLRDFLEENYGSYNETM